MKLGVITSAFARTDKDNIWDTIQSIAKIGFDTVDPFILDLGPWDSEERKKLKRFIKDAGLEVASITTYVNIWSSNEEVRKEGVKKLIAQLDFGKEMEATNMEVLAGPVSHGSDTEGGVPRSVIWRNSVDSMQQVARHAEKIQLRIAMELEPFETSLIYDIDSMLKFLAAVDSEYCLANLDIGHCHIMNRVPPKEIKRLGKKIIHTHISDNDGKKHNDWVPGEGTVDFKGYLSALKEMGYQGSVALELWRSPDPVASVSESYKYLAKLMGELGIRG